MADLKKLAQEIVGLTLLEAAELKKILKDEYGIEPAAGAVAVPRARPRPAPRRPRPPRSRPSSTSSSRPRAHRRST
jgi:hypothetical protein